ncbi:hypothetical protein ACE6H2_001601 [Prunus campanulata]
MANRGASSSSVPFTKSWKYHVFLSFRGFDTRSNFTSHLYSALRLQGINTFMDDDELRRGEEISSALLTEIEESKISVVVFSENYASSKWCLDELVKILDCKESNQQLVIPVFYKVNPSDVRNHRGSFGDALANMERRYKDEMDKVNKWRAALSQAAALSGFTLDEHRSEAELIHKIVQDISREVIDRTYLHVTEYPVGMHHPVQDIIKLLDLGENDVRMVGLWGTGGIGKTTIATAVYNSIAHEFEGCSFLANVRECSTWQGGGLAKLQRTLLYEILRDTNLEVANVHKGATMIKQRLSCRKVLLVLDDVDDMEQLHKLVGACDWFGVGSRIIITTRDKQLLTAHDVNLIHEVKILDDDKALELFSWYAFKRSGPPFGDYVKLAERAIRYAQGLPLALKVLGSCLCGGSIDKWEAALHGFKSPKIQDVLKISYNALDHSVQEVFLDIACFFKGKSRNYVTEACELNTRYDIDVLIEKALISVEHGVYIQMHDLLEKMGKDIIEQESRIELGERSRLWFHEDVEHVLTNNTGTNKITGIVLNFPKQDDEIFLNVGRSFSKMKNLKILINYNVYLFGDPSSIPNNLRVLEWHGCPFQYFPANFLQKALFVLNPFRMRIKQLGEGLKHLTKLTSLNFEGSKFLIEIPDLSNSPNLRYLNASRCRSLVEVHPSVGNLDKLVVLDFSFCSELTKFPNKVRLKSLNFFGLFRCIKLESFPEIVDKMKSLDELDLGIAAIKELPSSIGNLIGLQMLYLSGSAIKELPSSIGSLIGLQELYLSKSAIKELPSSIGNLIGLQRLDLSASAIKELPSSIGNLIGLQRLDLSESAIKELPSSIGNLIGLQELYLSKSAIKELPSSIGNLIGLQRLYLSESAIKELPSSIGNLIGLQRLDLSESAIKELPSSIGNLIGLQELYLSKSAIKELPSSIGNLIGLQILYLSESAIKELPSSIGNLIGLQILSLSESSIKELPSSIGNLIGLQILSLSESAIKELPSSIGNLIGLQRLYLSKSAIKELPSSIGNLIGLQELSLSESAIKELPSSIGNLIGLQMLYISGSAIKELPSSIGSLIGLQELYLSKSAIKELPSSIGNLIGLQRLDLSASAIKELPSSIGNLIGLQRLDLSESAIKKLPSSIGNLIGLQELYLSKSAIKELPSSIGNLIGLQILSLSESAVKELPSSIGNLIGLQRLYLSKSAIKELPSSIGNLIGLQELSLSESAIKELPSSIGNLIGLQELYLSKSAIKELPSSIGNLTALEFLNLEGCDNLANLPQSIYGLQNLEHVSLNRCPKLVTLPNNLISEVLSSAESLPLEVRTKSYSSFKGCS